MAFEMSTKRTFSSFAAVFWVILTLLPTSAFCQTTNYLSKGTPNGVALLPPPPKPGSAEEKADLETVRTVFNARTDAEKARAFKDAALSFSLFAPAIGSEFKLEKLPKTQALLQEVKKEIGIVIDIPKDHFKRKRPYQLDQNLVLGDPEPSYSYPSGHSTRGTVYSLVLAELFPEKKEAILDFGRTIGWDRVLIGKHFPTDIYAGRVLGKAIVAQLLHADTFREDLEAARREIEHSKSESAALDK